MRWHHIFISGLCLAHLSACGDPFTSGGGQADAGKRAISRDSSSEAGSVSDGSIGDGLVGDARDAAALGDAGDAPGDAGDVVAAPGDAAARPGDAGEGGGGNSNLGGDAAAGGESSVGGAPPDGCNKLDDCPVAQNCVAGACELALVSCASQKNSYPASKDGVYWIAAPGATQRVYCDMQLSRELCGEVEAEHKGRTRDKAAIGYTMTSVLLLSDGVCKMWAIRGTDLDHPFDRLQARGGLPEGQTCIALGFAADGELGVCNYDQGGDTCGWSTPLKRYGNYCPVCMENGGEFDHWTLQSPVSKGPLLSSRSGTTFTTCAIEPR